MHKIKFALLLILLLFNISSLGVAVKHRSALPRRETKAEIDNKEIIECFNNIKEKHKSRWAISMIDVFANSKALPSITFAQAIIETGWGSKPIQNNIFGIKGTTHNIITHEFINDSVKIKVVAKFMRFESINDAIEYHDKLLINKFNAPASSSNYVEWLPALQQYATDPNYIRNVAAIIRKYKLYLLDKNYLQNK